MSDFLSAEQKDLAKQGYEVTDKIEKEIDGFKYVLLVAENKNVADDGQKRINMGRADEQEKSEKSLLSLWHLKDSSRPVLEKKGFQFYFKGGGGNESKGEDANANEVKDIDENQIFGDFNKDGLMEVKFFENIGSDSWISTRLNLYSLDGGKASNLTENISSIPIELKDLDKNGVPELIGADSRFENFKNIDHNCTPKYFRVYSWRDGEFLLSSEDFKDFFSDKIEEAEEELKNNSIASGCKLGSLIKIFLSKRESGDMMTTWDDFEAGFYSLGLDADYDLKDISNSIQEKLEE